MDIDELIKYIDADDGTKKKNKKGKNKKPQQLSKNNKFVETTIDLNSPEKHSYSTETTKTSKADKIEDSLIEKELEEFKIKLLKDSIKFGVYSKLKPRFSSNWINELLV